MFDDDAHSAWLMMPKVSLIQRPPPPTRTDKSTAMARHESHFGAHVYFCRHCFTLEAAANLLLLLAAELCFFAAGLRRGQSFPDSARRH